MNEFRKKLERKVRFFSCYLCFSGMLFVIMSRLFPTSEGGSLTMGFFSGILLVMIFYIFRINTALHNEEKLKQMYIEETDERNIQLRRITGSTAIPIIIIGMGIAMVVSSFISMTVCLTLLGASLFASITTIITRLIVNKTL